MPPIVRNSAGADENKGDALITTQPVKSERDEDEESEIKTKQTCWQRFTASFNRCYNNMTDCLEFWCCKNECYDFCCNTTDFDEDDEEREVAYMRDVVVVDDQASLTDMSIRNSQAYEINNVDDGISETELHGDVTKSYHKGIVNHEGNDSGGDNHGQNHSGSDHHGRDRSGGDHHGQDQTGSYHHVGSHGGGNNHCVVSDSHIHSSGGGDCGGGDSGSGNYGGGDSGGGDCGGD